MLDIFLCDAILLNRCSEILSIKEAALGTDHYLGKSAFTSDISPGGKKTRTKLNLAALLTEQGSSDFASAFCEAAASLDPSSRVTECWSVARSAMEAAVQVLPP